MQNRNYTAWLHWNPTDKCNLACTYCLTKQTSNTENNRSSWQIFNQKEKINTIAIDKFNQTLEQTKLTFKISFTGGGEPFIIPNLVELCGVLAKKHFLSFNTNLTSNKISNFIKIVPPEKVMDIGASLHVDELFRLNLQNRFIENYLLLRKNGYNICAREIAHPSFSSRVPQIKKYFSARGIEVHFDPYVGEYKSKQYPEAYTSEELNQFGLQRLHNNTENIHQQENKICNAGYNAAYISPTGEIFQCPSIPKKIGHIYTEIKFQETLSNCTADFCVCPLNKYDTPLFEKAKKETNT